MNSCLVLWNSCFNSDRDGGFESIRIFNWGSFAFFSIFFKKNPIKSSKTSKKNQNFHWPQPIKLFNKIPIMPNHAHPNCTQSNAYHIILEIKIHFLTNRIVKYRLIKNNYFNNLFFVHSYLILSTFPMSRFQLSISVECLILNNRKLNIIL